MGDSERVSGTHAFLIGTPKSGTTWLAATISQNPNICVSNPKEPNIIATHKGTFSRSVDEPDWELYESFFDGGGIRLDASIHAFSCPKAPGRISDKFDDPRFILSFREPVSRIFSHWRMVLDSGEAKKNGVDWSEFESAWEDERLRCDSRYGSSMERWLQKFPLDRFYIIDSSDLRTRPVEVLEGLEQFLGLPKHDYNIDMSRNSNSASRRRPMSAIGKAVRLAFSLVPQLIKGPVVRVLQKRDLNIYNAPILSSAVPLLIPQEEHYRICEKTVSEEVQLLSKLTGFESKGWMDKQN